MVGNMGFRLKSIHVKYLSQNKSLANILFHLIKVLSYFGATSNFKTLTLHCHKVYHIKCGVLRGYKDLSLKHITIRVMNII